MPAKCGDLVAEMRERAGCTAVRNMAALHCRLMAEPPLQTFARTARPLRTAALVAMRERPPIALEATAMGVAEKYGVTADY
jgi:hypothetical protein